MKQQEMKFYRKEKNVIKKKCLFAAILFLVSVVFLSAQSTINKATYKLIQNVIISQDSIVSEYNRKLILEKFLRNEISAIDTTRYFSFIKEQKLYLNRNYDNVEIKYYLEKEFKKNKEDVTLIGINKKELTKIIAQIKKTKKTTIPEIFDKIKIIDSGYQNKPIHSFSSPFRIKENKYLIFHGKYSSPLNSFGELFIFKILKNGEYFIERTIPLYIS